MIELYQGDCLDILPGIKSGTTDLILSDMPFGTTQCKWDSQIDLNKLWPELKRISHKNTAILLFAQTPFDKILGCSNLEMLKYEFIWEKPNATGFFNAKKMPLKAHENILFFNSMEPVEYHENIMMFYKSLPVYNPQKTTGHERKIAGKKPVISSHYGKVTKKTNYDSTERYPRDVLKISSDKQKNRNLHPCRKPYELIELLIKTFSNEGFNVVDFCMGSGVTGEVCSDLNRNFKGIEKDHGYFKTAAGRIYRDTP